MGAPAQEGAYQEQVGASFHNTQQAWKAQEAPSCADWAAPGSSTAFLHPVSSHSPLASGSVCPAFLCQVARIEAGAQRAPDQSTSSVRVASLGPGHGQCCVQIWACSGEKGRMGTNYPEESPGFLHRDQGLGPTIPFVALSFDPRTLLGTQHLRGEWTRFASCSGALLGPRRSCSSAQWRQPSGGRRRMCNNSLLHTLQCFEGQFVLTPAGPPSSEAGDGGGLSSSSLVSQMLITHHTLRCFE